VAAEDKVALLTGGSGSIGAEIVRQLLDLGAATVRVFSNDEDGQFKDPGATAERLRDGWFHTRDVGYLDDQGFLHLTGRETNLINIGNEKVSPEEVERVLLDLPGVREAAVYGAPDALLGESVHARVVLEPGARLQVTQLQRHCRERFSGFKVPRRILIAESIPKTLYGKIDRRKLREEGEAPKEGRP
jgi:long-chain acyl-CoA synthetase